jgi:tetratricopeptide (TPR) repeat protein
MLKATIVCLALIMGVTSVLAASERDRVDCASPSTPATTERNIAACTRIINDPGESLGGRADAYNNRAWEYLKSGKAAQGLPDAESALQLRPDVARYLDTRGLIFEALGRREEAIADFRRALSLDPHDAELQASSGEALKRLGATP